MTDVEKVQKAILEDKAPFFDTSDILFYLEKNGGDINATAYEMLILKSEDSTISVNGLSTQDTSGYFKRIASRYKSFNSGVLPSE